LVQAFASGVLAAFVGFASSFAVIVQGLIAVGATREEASSGLLALPVSMGVCAIWLSLRTRLPISVAWSTPGGALLATSGAVEGGSAATVGAFLVCRALIVAAGLAAAWAMGGGHPRAARQRHARRRAARAVPGPGEGGGRDARVQPDDPHRLDPGRPFPPALRRSGGSAGHGFADRSLQPLSTQPRWDRSGPARCW
jgi:hypothetical protein